MQRVGEKQARLTPTAGGISQVNQYTSSAQSQQLTVTAGVFSTAGLRGVIEGKDGRLERGKYLSSKSALSAITVFLVVGL
jgi:hypothetical protein